MLARKSCFLLGPRQTGETFLIRPSQPSVPRFDLLNSTTYLNLSRDPARLAQVLAEGTEAAVIDEIQRLPDLLNEVHRDYVSGEPISYWRSTSGFEVDFIIGDHTAVEVKATANVGATDLKGLKAMAEEKRMKRLELACQEAEPRHVAGVDVLPLADFLSRLWAGEFANT